jgi:hypothetical protein
MPIQSKAQQRLMYAAAAGDVPTVPQSVGKDFVAAGPAGGSFAKLPAKKKMGPKMQKAYAEGRISDKVRDKHGYDRD